MKEIEGSLFKFKKKATKDEDEKLIFEGDPNDCEDLKEIQMENLKETSIKFKDTKLEVTDPLEEINLCFLEEPMVTYIGFLFTWRAKRKGSSHVERV